MILAEIENTNNAQKVLLEHLGGRGGRTYFSLAWTHALVFVHDTSGADLLVRVAKQ